MATVSTTTPSVTTRDHRPPVRDTDQSLAGRIDLGTKEGWTFLSTFAVDGLELTYNSGGPDVDIAQGRVARRADTGQQILTVGAVSGLSLSSSTVNYIYFKADNDYEIRDADTPPSPDALLIGTVDTSSDTVTEAVRGRSPISQFPDLGGGGGVDAEDDGSVVVSDSEAFNFGADLSVTDDGDSTVTIDASGGGGGTVEHSVVRQTSSQSVTSFFDPVTWDTVTFDETGGWDTSNNEWVAPGSGTIRVAATAEVDQADTTDEVIFGVRVNGTTEKETVDTGGSAGGSAEVLSVTVDCLLDVSSGDTVDVAIGLRQGDGDESTNAGNDEAVWCDLTYYPAASGSSGSSPWGSVLDSGTETVSANTFVTVATSVTDETKYVKPFVRFANLTNVGSDGSIVEAVDRPDTGVAYGVNYNATDSQWEIFFLTGANNSGDQTYDWQLREISAP